MAKFLADCRDLEFEFGKNCGCVLVKANLATGLKTDMNILQKSIALTGCVYVKLFADKIDDKSDLMTNPCDISCVEVSRKYCSCGRIELTTDKECAHCIMESEMNSKAIEK